jgi:hypothetical protein
MDPLLPTLPKARRVRNTPIEAGTPSAFGVQDVRSTYVPVEQTAPIQSVFDRNALLDPNTPVNNGQGQGHYSDFLQQDDYRTGNNKYSPNTEQQLNALRKREGNYDTIGDIGDGAGLSVGAYQFTEKSGSAQKLAKKLGINNYDKLSPSQRQSALAGVIDTPYGRRMQDNLVKQQYFRPAQRAAQRYGVTDPKAVEFLVDTNVNGGMQNVINRAKKMGGLSLDNLKKARLARYAYLIKKNPKKYAQYKDGWTNRVMNF